MLKNSTQKYNPTFPQSHPMLHRSISRLDEMSKKIFLMNYSGYTFQDIALKLRLSELTIQSKLQFIKNELKNELAGKNKV